MVVFSVTFASGSFLVKNGYMTKKWFAIKCHEIKVCILSAVGSIIFGWYLKTNGIEL